MQNKGNNLDSRYDSLKLLHQSLHELGWVNQRDILFFLFSLSRVLGANKSDVDTVVRSVEKMEVEYRYSSLSASLKMSVGLNRGHSRGHEKRDRTRKLSISLDMIAEGTIRSRKSVVCVIQEKMWCETVVQDACVHRVQHNYSVLSFLEHNFDAILEETAVRL